MDKAELKAELDERLVVIERCLENLLYDMHEEKKGLDCSVIVLLDYVIEARRIFDNHWSVL